MTNGFIGKTGQKIGEAARQAAKNVAKEETEFVKSLKTQVSGQSDQGSIVNEMLQGGDGISKINPAEEKKLENEARKKIQELEDELAKLRAERQKKQVEWSRDQDELMKSHEEEKQPVLIEPSTKPRRGFIGGDAKSTKGTGEMLKSKK
ncbi:hypothetical protein A2955_00405 [Candidatus Woesebacteria bacterium RIFCSPLOWO2_01_FULL_37_19]|uniref:Uncharacterized protein n=2 Tax=Candidatus Woeseibacteriota TaxID=1752722 RepID=A0A1F8B5N0_9BACT|nr:MAG: hypothetical protein A2771_03775 [Candidatus Woesebacteria bacterium RIFCSPHIGHO2_01_FULL_38_26b]OGM59342.1 MAG: hypothetical protein A2955_00405 [Candidatus Woesebacteria bacterium RIFCSPLOWO2_01_FULL_37_19]